MSAVAAFATVILLVLLFLGRRWCHTVVFGPKYDDEILTVNTTRVPLDDAPFGK